MSEPTGIEAAVCADIAARQQLGIRKYGVTVEQSPDDMLRHAYEEALDLCVYLKAEITRKDNASTAKQKAFDQIMAWDHGDPSAPKAIRQVFMPEGFHNKPTHPID